MELHNASPEDLRQRAQTARELAESWYVLLTILADELEALAAERDEAERPRQAERRHRPD